MRMPRVPLRVSPMKSKGARDIAPMVPGKPSATNRPSSGKKVPPQAAHSRPAAVSFSRLAWTSGSAQRII